MGNVISIIKQWCDYIFNVKKTKINDFNDENSYFSFKTGSINSKKNCRNKSKNDRLMINMQEINDECKENEGNNNEKNDAISPADYKSFQNKVFKHKITQEDFEVKILLGKGAFGKVKLVYNKELNKYIQVQKNV